MQQVDVFACQHCGAAAEASGPLAIVRHQLGCPTLVAQCRARWADKPTALPETPRQVPFAKWADFRPQTAEAMPRPQFVRSSFNSGH